MKEQSKFLEFYDVPYSTDEKHRFNVFIPQNKKDVPLLVMIHGGGWKSGTIDIFNSLMKEITIQHSIATASIGYRFINENLSVTYKDIYNDINNGISVIKRYIENTGCKVTKTAIGGTSAGAYNSLYYAYKKCNENPGEIAFVFDRYGPCDFSDKHFYRGTQRLDTDMAFRIFGQLVGIEYHNVSFDNDEVQIALKEASPINLVTKNSPPTLIAHDEVDPVVPISNSRTLFQKLKDNNVQTDFVLFENCGHEDEFCEKEENKFKKKLNEYIIKFLL